MIEYIINRGDYMAILIVIGVIAAEVISFMAVVHIGSELEYRIMDNLFKDGYKLNPSKIDPNCFDDIDKKIPSFVKHVFPFIPGVNIIFQKKLVKDYTNLFRNNEILKKSLVPITDKEKEIYEKIENKSSRYEFVRVAANLNEDMEIVDYKNGCTEIQDNCLYPIEGKRLEPLSYTYNEVIKLSKLVPGKYKLCRIDNITTAIIGIPEAHNEEMKRVHFPNEPYDKSHDVMPLTEPEDKKYVIYPFIEYNKLDDGIKEIKEDRKLKILVQ